VDGSWEWSIVGLSSARGNTSAALGFAFPGYRWGLQDDSLSHAQLDGAIRLFAGWEFRKRRKEEIMPPALRAPLQRARESTGPDLRARTERAFNPDS
jgi:hypothetical protein